MKKTRGLVAASLAFAAIFASNLVSAYYYFPSARFVSQDLVNTVVDFFQPILVVLLGQYSYTYVFETLLIFILLASIIYIAVGRIPLFENQKVVKGILTIVIPLLGVRFIDYQWLITIFQTYQLLALTLTCILPFLIYFYFLYNAAGDHGIIRKAGWALWVVIYIGLWSSDYANDLSSMVYFWTFIVGVVCLFGDNFIHNRLLRAEGRQRNREMVDREISKINREVTNLQKHINEGTASNVESIQKAIKGLEKSKKYWERQY